MSDSNVGLLDAIRGVQANIRRLPDLRMVYERSHGIAINKARQLYRKTGDRHKAVSAMQVDDDYFDLCVAVEGDLRKAARLAHTRGLSGMACLVLAEQLPNLEIGSSIATACAELEQLALAVEREPAQMINPDRQRKQRGLEAWNSGKRWHEVAELLDGDRTLAPNVAKEIVRFAKKTKQDFRTGTPGSPRVKT